MPVIVVGADTAIGELIVDALVGSAEVRAFITDPQKAPALKQRGAKVAIGDVSDGSHVGGAAMNSFLAVLVPEAALDDRERSFAESPSDVVRSWAEGLGEAGTTRVIWLEDERLERGAAIIAEAFPEVAVVATKGRDEHSVVEDVVRIERLKTLG